MTERSQVTPDHVRILREAAERASYRPSLADWAHVEECVDLGLLEVRDLEGGAAGTLAKFAYVITPRGLATLADGG